MNRKVTFLLIVALLVGAQGAVAQSAFTQVEFESFALLVAAASSDAEQAIPHGLRNNQYYLESQRLALLAQSAYDEGDYDASSNYAKEAIRYAQLSDDYVVLQLKVKEASDSIEAARQRLDWASSTGASAKHPDEYGEAESCYEISLAARTAEDWNGAIEAANKVIDILAYIQSPGGKSPLPAQYTVRNWATTKDCLWNIAGRPWAYGDPFKWQLIYNANKDKMPTAGDPDLIEPGMVLDIPSIKGEPRQGMWDSTKTYQ
jgi:nucleoid-associated protein YgaU